MTKKSTKPTKNQTSMEREISDDDLNLVQGGGAISPTKKGFFDEADALVERKKS